MQNNKEKISHKKVNQLTMQEAEKVLDAMKQSNQVNSKKYGHVKQHIEALKQI